MESSVKPATGSAARYEHLASDRNSFLEAARTSAHYTIPHLMPPEGQGPHRGPLNKPYSTLPARGVNHIASKFLMSMFPPNTPFFRLRVGKFEEADLASQKGPGGRTLLDEMQDYFSLTEQEALRVMENSGSRAKKYEVFRQLVVSGNVVYYEDGPNSRVFTLDQYVAKRDGYGNLIELVIKETTTRSSLDLEVQIESLSELTNEPHPNEDQVDVYTHLVLQDNLYAVHQEIDGQPIESTRGTFHKERCPYIVLRWNSIDGEDYGRGMVEEYIGDIISLEELTRSVVQLAAAEARKLYGVKPGSMTDVKQLAGKQAGDFFVGNPDDIFTTEFGSSGGLSGPITVLEGLQQSLRSSFLMVESVTRHAERVTAEEIRTMARELEDSLGGIYSLLTQEFLAPLARIIINQLGKNKLSPKFPAYVKPVVTTGVEAMGRGHDLQKLDFAIAGIPPQLQEAVAPYINIEGYLRQRFTALSVEVEPLLRSTEEIQQEQQAAMQQQQTHELMTKVAPGAIDHIERQATAE